MEKRYLITGPPQPTGAMRLRAVIGSLFDKGYNDISVVVQKHNNPGDAHLLKQPLAVRLRMEGAILGICY